MRSCGNTEGPHLRESPHPRRSRAHRNGDAQRRLEPDQDHALEPHPTVDPGTSRGTSRRVGRAGHRSSSWCLAAYGHELIAALERKGFLSKRSTGGDKRGVNVGITGAGLSVLQVGRISKGVAEQAVEALAAHEQQDLLITLVKMIKHLQALDAIPIQRMCTSCQYFAPFAHQDAALPHHCNFADAAFGQRDIRIDCRDHETADPSSRAATWDTFQKGSSQPSRP